MRFSDLIGMEMNDAELSEYDIHEAFAVSSVSNFSKGTFTSEDVEDVLYWHWVSTEGYGSMDVTFVCKLKDGRFGVLEAGCDTTGWDCQAGGTVFVAETLADAIRFGLDLASRDDLGLLLPEDSPSPEEL